MLKLEIFGIDYTYADGVPGDHIHYDVYNSLEEGSAELIIEKALPEDDDPDEDIHDPCLRFQR